MSGETSEAQEQVEDPEWLAQEQYLSTLPPEAFEPDDDAPRDIFEQDDIPRTIIDEARLTVGLMCPNTDPTQQIDRIHSLQRLLNACAGALAAEELAFADTQVASNAPTRLRPGTWVGVSRNRLGTPGGSHPDRRAGNSAWPGHWPTGHQYRTLPPPQVGLPKLTVPCAEPITSAT